MKPTRKENRKFIKALIKTTYPYVIFIAMVVVFGMILLR